MLLGELLGEFLGLILRVSPYFLIGAVTGALLESTIGPRRVGRWLGGTRSVPKAVALGAVLPGCSCATMPMAAGLRAQPASGPGGVAGFIVASPLLSPITLVLTLGVLGWEFTLARVIAALAGSLLFGMVVERAWGRRERESVPPQPQAPAVIEPGCASDCSPTSCEPEAGGRATFWTSLGRILRSITPYFVVGMLVAALLSVLIPEDGIPRLLGGSAGLSAFALAALVGIPLYVCEGEEVPITYALLAQGLAPGPALTFLLGSVGTCIPTMLMAPKLVGVAVTRAYVAFWVVFAIASGIAYELAT